MVSWIPLDVIWIRMGHIEEPSFQGPGFCIAVYIKWCGFRAALLSGVPVVPCPPFHGTFEGDPRREAILHTPPLRDFHSPEFGLYFLSSCVSMAVAQERLRVAGLQERRPLQMTLFLDRIAVNCAPFTSRLLARGVSPLGLLRRKSRAEFTEGRWTVVLDPPETGLMIPDNSKH